MKIHIDDSKSIAQIQEEFLNAFKYLKIEFFAKAHAEGESSPKKDLLEGVKLLSEIRTVHNEGDISITKEMTVNEVEQAFEDKFGIHVQLFRKQNESWLMTSTTDDWTLAKQIETAEFMETPAED